MHVISNRKIRRRLHLAALLLMMMIDDKTENQLTYQKSRWNKFNWLVTLLNQNSAKEKGIFNNYFLLANQARSFQS